MTQRFGAWSFDANVLYVLATKGAQQTDLGDRFQYNAAISYRLTGGFGAGGPMYLGALPEPMYHGGPGSHGKAQAAHSRRAARPARSHVRPGARAERRVARQQR